jgi:succinyl-diaminopimelate desuccinylase
MTDPISLAQELIRCPSVTPADAGAIGVLERALSPLGFSCRRLRFEAPGTAPIDNLYARVGHGAPHFCFAGHTDVVPPGETSLWRHDPFAALIDGDMLYGRGAADMKSAVAAFVAAAERSVTKGFAGSISLLITGDEEGPAVNGTAAVLGWMKEQGERIDHCIVGEPTATARAGDTIKIGRRGSMRVDLEVEGVQGHTAYPQRATNPIPILATIVSRLAATPIDQGTEHFEPTTLAFTTFDVGNPAGNVSPALARASGNLRFNDLQTPDTLLARMRAVAESTARDMGGNARIAHHVGALPFLTAPGAFTDLLAQAIASVNRAAPELSTGGGTSDARFIKDHCPVAEVGLPGTTMHKIDECAPVGEIRRLTDIYAAILERYFAAPPA